MKNPKLTPAGVTEKTVALYALSNQDLEAQAVLIRASLASWMAANFDLTQDQFDFIGSMEDSFRDNFSDQIAIAIEHKWPIIYKPGKRNVGVLGSKWLKGKEESQTNSIASEGMGYIGALIVETGY